jgi:hypothetical protein
MIANVSPSVLTYDDTFNTLNYANRAKNIKAGDAAADSHWPPAAGKA